MRISWKLEVQKARTQPKMRQCARWDEDKSVCMRQIWHIWVWSCGIGDCPTKRKAGPYDCWPGDLRLFFLLFVHVADRLLSHHTWASHRERHLNPVPFFNPTKGQMGLPHFKVRILRMALLTTDNCYNCRLIIIWYLMVEFEEDGD